MSKSQHPNFRESLDTRAPNDSFASVTGLVFSAEPPATWDFDCFRKCRTFDEIKSLAISKGLEATNEFGRIQLFRQGRLIGSFWLFD